MAAPGTISLWSVAAPGPVKFGPKAYCAETSNSLDPEWQFRFFLIPVVPALQWSKKLLSRLNTSSPPPRAGQLIHLFEIKLFIVIPAQAVILINKKFGLFA